MEFSQDETLKFVWDPKVIIPPVEGASVASVPSSDTCSCPIRIELLAIEGLYDRTGSAVALAGEYPARDIPPTVKLWRLSPEGCEDRQILKERNFWLQLREDENVALTPVS
jgi:hypothetical protein